MTEGTLPTRAAPSTLPPPGGISVLVETSRALPLVHLSITSKRGAAWDPIHRDGLSRFLARLMRRTGGGADPHALDARIDALGASVSIDANHSCVSFQATVIRRSFEPLVDLLEDIIARPALDSEEVERLRRETEGELVELLDNDRALARRGFRERFFADHPYGRSVLGTLASVRAITPKDLADGYAALLSGDLIFAFAGDVDPEQANATASRLAMARRTPDPLAPLLPDPAGPTGRHLVLVDKPERTQTQILIGGLGTHPTDPDHTALHVANTVFGGTFSARLTREIRAERGWSYGAYSSLPFDRCRQAFSLWTFPKAADAAPCIAHQLQMLEEWVDQGVTSAELDWVKQYLVRSHAFAIDTAPKRVGLALDEALYDLPDSYYECYTRRVEAVTIEEVNEAIRQRINPANLVVAVLGTAATIRESIAASIPALATVEVTPFDLERPST